MKKICTLLLTAGMLFGAATGASAIDFKASGEWIFGFGMTDVNWEDNDLRSGGTGGSNVGMQDTFSAMQRVRLQIDAVASEALSATVFFEIGDQNWGSQGEGAALGTDGIQVKVRYAYLDWFVPNTDLSFRMGLQAAAFPNVAGGGVILDDDAAGIVANYKINDMASVTLAWFRPYNDNYGGGNTEGEFGFFGYSDDEHNRSNYLDNLDIFLLSIPLQGENWSINPWFAIGFMGDNVYDGMTDPNYVYDPGTGTGSIPSWSIDGMNEYDSFNGGMATGTSPLFGGQYTAARFSTFPSADWLEGVDWNGDEDAYTTIWFAGLPMTFQYDAWNFELDLNYGYVQYSGTYSALDYSAAIGGIPVVANAYHRVDNSRQGWLIKGLAEYKMDWGTPGIFAWYGSGDDDDVRNGSEMMPYIAPSGNFTSFLGDGELGWQPGGGYDQMLSYSGTWGIGLQIKDLSFMEDLSHIIRIAYWGGTNSSSMTDFIQTPYLDGGGFYLTTDDYLVEVNFDTTYQIYENLAAHLQLGYIFNGIDHDNYKNWDGTDRLGDARDGYKATLSFQYSF